MTAGNSGASTPEDDDPFGYLYADGQAKGAQPPSGGYGYPHSVNRVRTVGQRQYGQPPAAAQQQNAHYAAPETYPGGAPAARQQHQGGAGRGRGPNTRGLLIGAVAVVAAVVTGIGIAMISGDPEDKDENKAGGTTPTVTQSAEPTPSTSTSAAPQKELPKIDAKALLLENGVTTASDVPGAKADGGVYVTNFNNLGASVTWNVNGIPEDGKYTLFITYGVPGKDGTATLTVNGKPSTTLVKLKNWAGAPEGDYEKGWTKTYNYIQLNKGTNTIKISCEAGNQCDANFDQLWLAKGWVGS
ncbi:CBM35 domain-containing protein [Streptomyces thermoalcalitolerans]|uniref:CBM35 domain-containing protein n=1 Tax=Streptomyces thermoalcalitolerans TaxID=65605 RepID=A0ABN1P2Z3_9ACTN